ncbi:hypothetical protein [Streptomyces sp. Ru62]|uniref:hypothetical protein n=1 Tax=Streptomyces sp. Ru62 TaxID=2080745 RepID=UPI0015E3FC48|nr:hypothetical protein [Streptomyces sp. Ru62]
MPAACRHGLGALGRPVPRDQQETGRATFSYGAFSGGVRLGRTAARSADPLTALAERTMARVLAEDTAP